MDLNELLKSAPQLQGIATTIVAGVPIAEIVKRIVVPSADVLGKRMADRVERCFAKTATMIEDAGLSPQQVADKLIVEILRGASLEDNEELHTMWAALLANAGSPENANKVRPGFIALLKQMAPDEAGLLNWISQRDDASQQSVNIIDLAEGFQLVVGRNIDVMSLDLHVCLSRLDSEGLIASSGDCYYATPMATAFLEACRPPNPKE